MPDNQNPDRFAAFRDLGWSPFFEEQLGPEDEGFVPRRIAAVHRARMTALAESGIVRLSLPPHANTGDYCVGDWILTDPRDETIHRRLARRTLLDRRTHGRTANQLAAANVDTLFIVTSCNEDFNVARLERYLAFANEAETTPVILLTKADMTPDPQAFVRQAQALQRGLPVLLVHPRMIESVTALAPWCGVGQTVALVGSSGVGKSTLVNTLAGPDQVLAQETGAVREGDSKGRHTTTARSIHAIAGGGWVIDTPGMRNLQISEATGGLETLFAEITELAPNCRFRDCTHAHEPGCAVRAAVADGRVEAARLDRWRKLTLENGNQPPALPVHRRSPQTVPKRR